MPKFVSDAATPVSVAGDPAVIYVRERLNSGQMQQIATAGLALNQSGANVIGAMWDAYVLRWENVTDGDKSIPCTPANMRRLDPNDPLVEAVSDLIAERFTAQNAAALAADEQVKN